jgi:hypothetical protein
VKRLEAAIKDSAARRWSERRTYYRVGSFMKGCANCGETELVELPNGKEVLRYTSGFQVFRSYDPKWVGWTWWCYECGAKDLKCWSPDPLGMVEAELGKPPVQGARGVKSAKKYELRRELMRFAKADAPKVSTCDEEIARLEEQLANLIEALKKGGR